MNSKPAYPTNKIYKAFLHRELSVSWLVFATLLGGRHRLDPALLRTGFRYLEFGCGYGLNLLFNAAAHPQASFYGLDLNPTHIAKANARAEALGVSNVQFALADLSSFAAGLPSTGPCRAWPEAYDFVVAHGLVSWVSAEVRNALVAAAASLLRPGGLFYCSYNTYPGWLPRSTLQMLSQEEAVRAGGETTLAGIRKAADTLVMLMGPEGNAGPLGRALPGLRTALEGIGSMPEAYVGAEYQSAHQPLYVGPVHRLCGAHGLTFISSATLADIFPQMLDPERRSLVMGAVDLPMREVLLDLATNQAFRRDLFVKGPCPPSTLWLRQVMADLQLHLSAGSEDDGNEFDTSLGRLSVDADFVKVVRSRLAERPENLGELMDHCSIQFEEMLMRLAVLVSAGVIGVSFSEGSGAEANEKSISSFNQRCLELNAAGEEIGALLSPTLLQPVKLSLLESFFLQAADADLPPEDVAQLVWMGISMAGGRVNDSEGRRIEEPQRALSQLQEFWESFARERLPVLRRLGLINPAASLPAP